MASSIPRYAARSLQIMLRAFISYRPFSFFFSISCFFLAVGLTFLAFLGLHYLEAGAFSPHIWAGFVGGSFIYLGVSTLITGLIGDMLVRIRMNQENILYYLKRSRLDDDKTGEARRGPSADAAGDEEHPAFPTGGS